MDEKNMFTFFCAKMLFNNEFVSLLLEWSSNTYSHILDNPRFYPRVTSILCKSGLCVVLHLRANYILVSFSEYHPDKHYTWLPFPAAQCNPSLQKKKKNRKKRRRKRDTETERGVKRERERRSERSSREEKVYIDQKRKRKKRICQNVESSTDLIKETDCFRLSEKHVAL